MSNLDLALSVALGIGLAAATGFRLFLPLLILSGAAYTGHASLNHGFAWLGTPVSSKPRGAGLRAARAARRGRSHPRRTEFTASHKARSSRLEPTANGGVLFGQPLTRRIRFLRIETRFAVSRT